MATIQDEKERRVVVIRGECEHRVERPGDALSLDAIVQDALDRLPTIDGELQRCDLCHGLTPVEWLQILPCDGFVLLLVATEDSRTTTCECHAPSDLLAPGKIVSAVAYSADWI